MGAVGAIRAIQAERKGVEQTLPRLGMRLTLRGLFGALGIKALEHRVTGGAELRPLLLFVAALESCRPLWRVPALLQGFGFCHRLAQIGLRGQRLRGGDQLLATLKFIRARGIKLSIDAADQRVETFPQNAFVAKAGLRRGAPLLDPFRS